MLLDFLQMIVHCLQDQSWGTRWLRGRKVSSVLATSKLASKVRSKIKEKKAKIDEKKDEEPEPEKEPEIEAPLNVEVGSVDHYKELTKNTNWNCNIFNIY